MQDPTNTASPSNPPHEGGCRCLTCASNAVTPQTAAQRTAAATLTGVNPTNAAIDRTTTAEYWERRDLNGQLYLANRHLPPGGPQPYETNTPPPPGYDPFINQGTTDYSAAADRDRTESVHRGVVEFPATDTWSPAMTAGSDGAPNVIWELGRHWADPFPRPVPQPARVPTPAPFTRQWPPDSMGAQLVDEGAFDEDRPDLEALYFETFWKLNPLRLTGTLAQCFRSERPGGTNTCARLLHRTKSGQKVLELLYWVYRQCMPHYDPVNAGWPTSDMPGAPGQAMKLLEALVVAWCCCQKYLFETPRSSLWDVDLRQKIDDALSKCDRVEDELDAMLRGVRGLVSKGLIPTELECEAMLNEVATGLNRWGQPRTSSSFNYLLDNCEFVPQTLTARLEHWKKQFELAKQALAAAGGQPGSVVVPRRRDLERARQHVRRLEDLVRASRDPDGGCYVCGVKKTWKTITLNVYDQTGAPNTTAVAARMAMWVERANDVFRSCCVRVEFQIIRRDKRIEIRSNPTKGLGDEYRVDGGPWRLVPDPGSGTTAPGEINVYVVDDIQGGADARGSFTQRAVWTELNWDPTALNTLAHEIGHVAGLEHPDQHRDPHQKRLWDRGFWPDDNLMVSGPKRATSPSTLNCDTSDGKEDQCEKLRSIAV